MTAIREQILEDLRTRLAGIAGFPGLSVHRNVSYPEDEAELPVLIVVDGGHERLDDAPEFSIWRMTATIDGMVKSSQDGGQGTAVNALYAAAVKSVMAEPQFSPLIIDVREGAFEVTIDRSRGVDFVAMFQLELLIDFATRDNDPESPAP